MIHSKALVTTDVTDGFKTSLNINKAEVNEIEFDHPEGHNNFRDARNLEPPKPKQKTIESFFTKK